MVFVFNTLRAFKFLRYSGYYFLSVFYYPTLILRRLNNYLGKRTYVKNNSIKNLTCVEKSKRIKAINKKTIPPASIEKFPQR